MHGKTHRQCTLQRHQSQHPDAYQTKCNHPEGIQSEIETKFRSTHLKKCHIDEARRTDVAKQRPHERSKGKRHQPVATTADQPFDRTAEVGIFRRVLLSGLGNHQPNGKRSQSSADSQYPENSLPLHMQQQIGADHRCKNRANRLHLHENRKNRCRLLRRRYARCRQRARTVRRWHRLGEKRSDHPIVTLKLEIVGLMTAANWKEVARQKIDLVETAHKEFGIADNVHPIMALSFLALAVIPELRITDKGLFDAVSFKHIPVDAKTNM